MSWQEQTYRVYAPLGRAKAAASGKASRDRDVVNISSSLG